jgi:hypothetical protein
VPITLSIKSFLLPVTTPVRGIINISANATWSQNAITVAGADRGGHHLYQLSYPSGLYVDDNDTVYIADSKNNRIIKWVCCVQSGHVVAGGNGVGNRSNQLSNPADVIVDRQSDSLIICDEDNRRVLRWYRRCPTSGETIISNISCRGLTMDDRAYLYISDRKKHAVLRWRGGDAQAVVVAGGNDQGDRINQLNTPGYIFVDRNYSLYVSDVLNHRVMKWVENAKEGSIVAGGRGEGKDLTQLGYPQGVVVDQFGTVYVVDTTNNRIMIWRQGKKIGSVLVDGDVAAARPNYLRYPTGLSFDLHGNLYVVDMANHRVRRFSIE